MARAREELGCERKDEQLIGKLTQRDEKNKTSKKWSQTNNQRRECGRCGLKHDVGKCSASQSKCFRCNKIGHFARQCKAATVRTLEEEDEEQVGNEVSIQKTQIDEMRTSRIPRATIAVELNGQEVRMEFDSGARASMIGLSLWKKIGAPKLEKSRSGFVAYGSNTWDVKRECMAAWL